ncbi:hypothetical protein HNP84_010283 [Thermocatellispora tengchongensis]|uniref:Uncharacterized protein n=1 Tax=Thermocatellispora tengchongensis TaxID=1073253 RepID=A0A840PXD5_9ACTN|nr:hypothetical protein [Thermocatellispora tengchongensis]MBB5140515.1 hypothetical protein [Thermocatellispora tengchongensis]
MKFETVAVKIQPYQKALLFGVAIAFFGGLVVFGGVWALVIAVVCLYVGIMLGLIGSIKLVRRHVEAEMAALRAQYESASELVYKMIEERDAQAQRAESAERDLLASAAEKTALRAQLDALHANGAA